MLGCGNLLKGSDIPASFPHKDSLYPDADEWVNPGDSVVIEPGGKVVAGPMHREAGILFHDIDPALARRAKRALDVAGHYARPDIFSLHVDNSPREPVSFSEDRSG